MDQFFNNIREEISSIWTLLNDTETFLNRVDKFDEFEQNFREWRLSIKSKSNNHDNISYIKQEIINLRKSLRLQGYDLKLGSKDIKIYGFKNDEAVNEGYRRLVIVIGDGNIYHTTGVENHQELMRFICLKNNVGDIFSLGEVHSLWYRWKDNILQLCGADSETKNDLEKFDLFMINNKNLLLKKLKYLP